MTGNDHIIIDHIAPLSQGGDETVTNLKVVTVPTGQDQDDSA